MTAAAVDAEPRRTPCPTGCGRGVRTGHLMCGPCWHQVPRDLQRDVVRTWKAYNDDPTDQAWFAYVEAREAALKVTP